MSNNPKERDHPPADRGDGYGPPIKNGYQPTTSELDDNNPPGGDSPSSTTSDASDEQ